MWRQYVTKVAQLSGLFFPFYRRRFGTESQMATMVVRALILLPEYSVKLCF